MQPFPNSSPRRALKSHRDERLRAIPGMPADQLLTRADPVTLPRDRFVLDFDDLGDGRHICSYCTAAVPAKISLMNEMVERAAGACKNLIPGACGRKLGASRHLSRNLAHGAVSKQLG
jgi:hypothetical protein